MPHGWPTLPRDLGLRQRLYADLLLTSCLQQDRWQPNSSACYIGDLDVVNIFTNFFEKGLSARELEGRKSRLAFERKSFESKISVAVLHNWSDFELSLKHLTPNGDGVWGEVSFGPYGAVKNPDFVLVLNSIATRWKLLRLPPERLWFGSSEAPNDVHTAWNEGQGKRSTTVTVAKKTLQSSTGKSYIQSPPVCVTWWVNKDYQELSKTQNVSKRHDLSWVTSNFSNLEGHRTRLKFLNQLKNRIDFDLFGRGFSPIDDKWDALAPYRYSIAFENTIAPHYFTEKLMDCFVSHTMPIYFGAPNIANYFPEKAIVVIDPSDPDVFKKIKDVVASNLWLERMPYILEAKQLVLNKYNVFAQLADMFSAAANTPPSKKEWIVLGSRKLRFN